MIHTIQVADPSAMERMLVLCDPFHDSMPQGRSASWSLQDTGRLAARFVHHAVRDGIDYIVRCELG